MVQDENINIVIFGGNNKNYYPEIDFKVHHFNKISDNKILKKLYNAGDVMVVPSKMETFGQTALESIACGTPVVAFKNTGLSDIIDHKENGYLAEFLNVKDLAHGITWILKNSHNNFLSINARKKAENFFF